MSLEYNWVLSFSKNMLEGEFKNIFWRVWTFSVYLGYRTQNLKRLVHLSPSKHSLHSLTVLGRSLDFICLLWRQKGVYKARENAARTL